MTIKEKIINEIENISTVPNYVDLISFSICGEYFDEDADFDEVIVVVEKDWLLNHIVKTEQFKDTDASMEFLKNDYTSDESYEWYASALVEKKIVAVNFL